MVIKILVQLTHFLFRLVLKIRNSLLSYFIFSSISFCSPMCFDLSLRYPSCEMIDCFMREYFWYKNMISSEQGDKALSYENLR